MDILMFTIGTVIFIAYMFGLLTMINKSHKDQEKEINNNSQRVDTMDMDGMGNFSRFPTKTRRMEEFGYRKVYFKGNKEKEKSN